MKSDWWIGHEGQAFLPLPQLVEELRREAKIDFYMFTTPNFFYQAKDQEFRIQRAALDELQENLRQRREQLERDQRILEEGGLPARYLSLKSLARTFDGEETKEVAGMRFSTFIRDWAHQELAKVEQELQEQENGEDLPPPISTESGG